MEFIMHLGLRLMDKKTNHINREYYLAAKPDKKWHWDEEKYPEQLRKAAINYDANMRYFESLNSEDFEKFIGTICKRYKLKECVDLNDLQGVEGLYMMVLDQYKQIYIGLSQDMKARVRKHWYARKTIETLIFGTVCTSNLSIDSFGALDTTRVFYRKTRDPYQLEEKILDGIDTRYVLNRTAGGLGYGEDEERGLLLELEVLAGEKKKDLIPYIDVQALKQAVSQSTFEYYLDLYPQLKKRIENE